MFAHHCAHTNPVAVAFCLQLEEQLAKFMGTDEAIIYSYDIATISSVIPAFANRKDVLVLDEVGGGGAAGHTGQQAGHTKDTFLTSQLPLPSACALQLCSFPIQQGATLSRAAVHFFKHNDMEDLERVLQAVDREEKRQK
jgi:serine palmitoyltransferase